MKKRENGKTGTSPRQPSCAPVPFWHYEWTCSAVVSPSVSRHSDLRRGDHFVHPFVFKIYVNSDCVAAPHLSPSAWALSLVEASMRAPRHRVRSHWRISDSVLQQGCRISRLPYHQSLRVVQRIAGVLVSQLLAFATSLPTKKVLALLICHRSDLAEHLMIENCNCSHNLSN